MNTQNNRFSKAFFLGLGLFSFISFSSFSQDVWKAPASADAKKNPFANDAGAVAAGKKVYVKSCLDCHGRKGKGDGPKSAELDKKMSDFTKPEVQQQSDGAMFWKVTEGKKPMPRFSHDLTAEQRWQAITYIRTLK